MAAQDGEITLTTKDIDMEELEKNLPVYQLGEESDGEYEEEEEEEEDTTTKCLFNDNYLTTPVAVLKDAKDNYGFDLTGIRQEMKLDFYGTMKLVNIVRSLVKEKRSLYTKEKLESAGEYEEHIRNSKDVGIQKFIENYQDLFDGDTYLAPTIRDDGLLLHFSNFEMDSEEEDEDGKNNKDLEELENQMKETKAKIEEKIGYSLDELK
eukprot:CAMPEP_0201509908 /NCGR_PEP_ID=MMETSP0161_2-20130828/2820_1 /ASSEMBLY_ACC=CAM_ASM_000251 /TAXON_ID=180227 /ORGANISM="Neoparamoeba aestuarina, Strain SoJaBio B1-5/56/2" /LENGTH=207 /DNA_ID=CAMNT_0047904999 /DNA_START=45 /DNA_END=668 /DNA_ORIENTATION=+